MTSRGYSQVERALAILDTASISSHMEENSHISFLFKRIERVTTALYILTSYFPDSEPLKWELRKTAAELIKDILSLNESVTVFAKEFFHGPVATLTRIMSLLSLAHIAHLVSPMNFSVFQKALRNILSVMEDRGHLGDQQYRSSPLFKETFFGVGNKPLTHVQEVSRIGRNTPPRLMRKEGGISTPPYRMAEKTKAAARTPLHDFLKDTDKGHGVLDDVAGHEAGIQGQLQEKGQKTRRPHKGHILKLVTDKIRAERQQIIVEVLRKKGVAMIRDFSSLIGGCSEKTIQRQLQELVRDGVLKKEGVRRWSSYSLVVAS